MPGWCSLRASCAICLALVYGSSCLADAVNSQSAKINGITIGIRLNEIDRNENRFAVSIDLHDATSGLPVTGAAVASWMLPAKSRSRLSEKACEAQITRLLNAGSNWKGGTSLNKFEILLIAADATLRIINPLASFGGSQLERIITLPGVPQSWSLSDDGGSLALSMKDQAGIVIVDLRTFKVSPPIAPLGMDQHAAVSFAGKDGLIWTVARSTGAIIGIDPSTGGTVKTVAFSGDGTTKFFASPDGEHLFVIREGNDKAILFDTLGDAEPRLLDAGEPFAAASWSELANKYYALTRSGTILAADETLKPAGAVAQARSLVFSPDGRYAFIIAGDGTEIAILDSASEKVIGKAEVNEASSGIVFSDSYAYVLSDSGGTATLIDLSALKKDAIVPLRVQLAALEAGRHDDNMPASSATLSPEGNAVFVVNPAARVIAYYVEGMMAPSGTISAAAPGVRDIILVDDGIKETTPGNYSAETTVLRRGDFTVPVIIDQPRAAHCFNVNLGGDDDAKLETIKVASIVPVGNAHPIAAGNATLAYRLADSNGETMRGAPVGVQVHIMEETGAWQVRRTATTGRDGDFSLRVRFPKPGLYRVSFSVPAFGLNWGQANAIDVLVNGDTP